MILTIVLWFEDVQIPIKSPLSNYIGTKPGCDDINNPGNQRINKIIQGFEAFIKAWIQEVYMVQHGRGQRGYHQLIHDVQLFMRQGRDVHIKADKAIDEFIFG